MDHTGWLEFFSHGLATQMNETVARGTRAIKIDLLVREHRLNQRHIEILHEFMDGDEKTIQDFERLIPDITRRTLQRDLKRLEDIGLLSRFGETNQLKYRAKMP